MPALRSGLVLVWSGLVAGLAWGSAAPVPVAKGPEDRIRRDVTYLASPALEGRGPLTPGINKAADYIAEEFKKAGLAPVKGSYFQPFAVPARLKDAPARLVLRGPKGEKLDLVEGVSFNVVPISGTVLVDGQPLPAGAQIPFGATIDATNGIVSVTTVGPGGVPQTAYFFGGVFQLVQGANGVTELVMKQGDFSVCQTSKTTKKAPSKRAKQAAPAKNAKDDSKKVVRELWGTGKGSFRTKGRFASATVRGTLWLVADRCDGTYTQVNEGVVTVLDLVRNRTIVIKTGRSVLVRPK